MVALHRCIRTTFQGSVLTLTDKLVMRLLYIHKTISFPTRVLKRVPDKCRKPSPRVDYLPLVQ